MIRNDNDIVVPMDVSVLKGKGGEGKDGKGKAKLKDDKDKADPKSNPNKDKKCFCCDEVGHVKSECRKKMKDDEERKATPLSVNVPANASMACTSALRQITIPSYFTDDDFHSPMRIFALNVSSHTGAAHSACPSH